MPIRLPNPQGVRLDKKGGEIPLWRCPNCQRLKRLEKFGFRKRDDIKPGQDVWMKQSWCEACR